MVIEWSPDPPQNHCGEEVGPVGSSNFTVMGGSSSDSETDEVGNNGYELLPMEPVEGPEGNSDGEDEGSDCDTQAVLQPVDAEESSGGDLVTDPNKSVSDVPTTPEQSQDMDPETMDKIRAAMSGFSLPLTAVPSWAFHIPEEEWRSHLVERMQIIQDRGRHLSTTSQSETNVNKE
ncbi:male-enhanced antigen 1 [Ischnura elegans]|uniref:male-enhanced antigen 1 n=1 Tax=Ischnura elegans TaxID=197161 RepID=UPI001ED8AEDF|nr:male-enhanced antigen 1 [Ischnura elegans]